MIFIAEDTTIASQGLWKLATLGYACDLDALAIINPFEVDKFDQLILFIFHPNSSKMNMQPQ